MPRDRPGTAKVGLVRGQRGMAPWSCAITLVLGFPLRHVGKRNCPVVPNASPSAMCLNKIDDRGRVHDGWQSNL